MIPISRSRKWDKALESLRENIALKTAARGADIVLSAVEQQMGIGTGSRVVMFGRKHTGYRSLLLSYQKELLDRMIQERQSVPVETKQAGTPPRPNKQPENLLTLIGKSTWPLKTNSRKVLEGDTMTPRERVERHVRFDSPDRVAVAPLLGFHTAGAGGVALNDFMKSGHAAASAAVTTWNIYGGFDMMPFHFPMNYAFPVMPEAHSRFYSEWIMPTGDELPKLDEKPLLACYEQVAEEGFSPLLRTEQGNLLAESAAMLLESALFYSEMSVLFPGQSDYFPYSIGVINHPADLLSMWFGFERFMMDCVTDPLKIRESCERLAPGLVEMGIFPCKLTGINQVLYGMSRVSPSWVSLSMFENLFADVFRGQVETAFNEGIQLTYHLDNDYTPALDFFLTLPAHSGLIHFDQTDMFRAKEKLHGHLCLMGNLHPGLLAAGTPQQVTDKCEKLIKEIGADGGFVLSSACEVPFNAPVENIRAAKEAVDRWGWY
ncbi:MAG TPA: uroporphyrinogen decarboxylase family protein [bacterium]|nr:uroporphyrinogen decarboxylase family protein [bacterium]